MIVDILPKCDFCGKGASYDAPTVSTGSWAYMCKSCALSHGNLSMGTKFELRKKYEGKVPDKPVNAIESTDMDYWEQVLEEGIREPECPTCGEVRRMEPDATSFTCDGYGTKCRMSGGLF